MPADRCRRRLVRLESGRNSTQLAFNCFYSTAVIESHSPPMTCENVSMRSLLRIYTEALRLSGFQHNVCTDQNLRHRFKDKIFGLGLSVNVRRQTIGLVALYMIFFNTVIYKFSAEDNKLFRNVSHVQK